MSDDPQVPATGTEPDFDDPSYADVRALLAAARAEEPIPTALAAELDETLANLVAQRAKQEASTGATVVPLRRAWPSRFLVAASTVVLLGAGAVGLAQVVGTGTGDDRSATALDSSADSDAPAAPEAAAGGIGSVTEAPQALVDNLNGLSLTYGAGTLPRFSAKQFDRQVADFVAGDAYLYDLGSTPMSDEAPPPAPVAGDPVAPAPDAGGDAGSDPGTGAGSGTTDEQTKDASASKADRSRLLRSYTANAGCPGPTVADGSTVIRIRYAGTPATLVVRPAVGGARQVEAWSCDGSERLAATSVPAS